MFPFPISYFVSFAYFVVKKRGILNSAHQKLYAAVQVLQLNMLVVKIGESAGKVNTQRHKKDGFRIGASVSQNMGLDRETPSHQSAGFETEYHRILNSHLQFSSWLRTGYTNTDIPALMFCLGSGDVIGHRSGELYGNAFYAAYLGMHVTWFNYKWLSLENAYFFNWGNGAGNFEKLFTEDQKLAAGTALRFNIPAIPWLYGIFTFNYSGPGGEWFKFKNN